MKQMKMLLLAVVAGSALASIGAGAASATELEDDVFGMRPAGTTVTTEAETTIVFDLSIGQVACGVSTISMKQSNTGGASDTVKGNVEVLSFSSCNATVVVLAKGSLEIHATGNSNGTVTSTGAEFTVEMFGVHCIYRTFNTDIGNLTGGSPATLDGSGTITKTGGRSGAFCGSFSQITGGYEVVVPPNLYVT